MANPFASKPNPFGQQPAPAFGAAAPSPFGQTGQQQPSLFGAAPAPSPFGQPGQQQTSLFGGASTPFGQQQRPSLFGAASTPTTQPSLLGAPPAFGQTSAPAFGASTAPSLFGTPGASTGLTLGAQTSPSPFGASPFPGATPSAPSLFGGATSSSLFGAPGASKPAFGFGASSTPSLFSSPATAAPQFGASLFGTPGGGVGGTQGGGAFQAGTSQQAQAQLLQTLMAPAVPGASAQPQADVNVLVDAYNAAACGAPPAAAPGAPAPHGRAAHFCAAFLSITHPLARLRPPGVPDPVWNEAVAQLMALPQEHRALLWPEVVWGNQGLEKRLHTQDEALKADKARLEEVEAAVGQLRAHLESLVASRANRVRQQQQQLQKRLLRVMHIVEVLQLKGSSSPLSLAEMELVERLRALLQMLRGSSDLPQRVDAVLAAAEEQQREGGLGELALRGGGGGGLGEMDAPSTAELFRLIASQSDAIAKLVSTVEGDSRALAIMSGDQYSGLGQPY